MNALLSRPARTALGLVLLFATLAGAAGTTVASQTSGTTYTSPNFGYSVTWSSPWYVTEDGTDGHGYDLLGLADGQSVVYFSGGRSGMSSPSAVVADYATQIATWEGMSNVQQLDPSQCITAEAGTAVACYRADQTFDDGTQSGTGILLKAWDLGDGVDLLFEGYAEEASLPSYLSKWQQFQVYAAGQAVPTPAGGCQITVEHNATFCFDPSLPERDRGDITEAVRLGQDLIARYYGNPDMSDLRVNGFNAVSESGNESLASTIQHSVVVYGNSDVWQGIAPLERVETVVHELFHVYQNVMTESSSAAVPLWFSEGSAEAVGFQAVSQLGVTDQAEIYDLNLYSLTDFPVGPLSDLQTGDSMGADSYPLAYIAVQYLLGGRGMSIAALGDVYTQLEQGATFEEAFTTIFGESLEQFYTDFEAWRPSLQKVNDLPDDFWPNEGDAPPAAIAVQSAPAHAARDQQVVVVAKTASLTDCEADLSLGESNIQRQTYSNGEGEIFWLITIPADAPVGPATLNLTCGLAATPVTFTVT